MIKNEYLSRSGHTLDLTAPGAETEEFMTKKTEKNGNLGRLVIKARFRSSRASNTSSQTHTSNIEDGSSWANGRSITEQSDLDELMQVAQLSRTDFTAVSSSNLANKSKIRAEADSPAKNLEWIRIPRRPKWNNKMMPQELRQAEEDFFLEWRKGLARIEDAEHFILTPFERNLEIWRQLWRVIEACETTVQILDARNPLLFYCEDLLTYIKEVGESKKMILLINKADFLEEDQRKSWANYFSEVGLSAVFYSAKIAMENDTEESDAEESDTEENADTLAGEELKIQPESYDILSRSQLLDYLKEKSEGEKLGMVGYPNVGKSSTINSLAGCKKVSVAATPGKTKHFQTIILDNGVVLYDCPGLVFPNFAVSRADLVLNGILPVDQLKEWISPVELLTEHMPRRVIEAIYGIEIRKPGIEEDPNRKPTPHEVLASLAVARGFRTSFHGNPDESRSARMILKDYVGGKLLFCHPPPSNPDKDKFNSHYRDAVCNRPMKNLMKIPESSYVADQDPILIAGHGANAKLSGMSGTTQFKKPMGSKKHYKRAGFK